MSIAARPVVDRDENKILLAARLVREYYFPDRAKNRPDWTLILAVRELLDRSPDATPEDLFDLLITQPRMKTEGHLSRYLAASLTAEASSSSNGNSADINVFTGGRRFSFTKLSAMAASITLRGENISKDKLNYLLFYGDFVHYFLYGQSISGARYVRDAYGPVLQRYENILKTLVYAGVVRVKDRYGSDEGTLILRDRMILGELTILETITMHWVLANLGSMSGSEISQYAHREIAHRFTRQDEYIAYEYARILKKLPDRPMI